MYIRKTHDEWDIETNYGCGWESEYNTDDRKEAKSVYANYKKEYPYLVGNGCIGIRLRKHRVPNPAAETA